MEANDIEEKSGEESARTQKFPWGLLINLILCIVVLLATCTFLVPYAQSARLKKSSTVKVANAEAVTELSQVKQNIEKSVKMTDKKLNSLKPTRNYLIVNSINNEFYLYSKGEMIHTGICSTGNNTLLEAAKGDKKWFFRTPQGVFRIRTKVKDPLWVKPDWAFIEDGLPVPSATDPSRYEYGVLGDYAMSIGNGYLIHGTLYKRFLGLPVTHGCIRLNDEDLEIVYNTLEIGSSVYIY